jgi:hypothetical protein
MANTEESASAEGVLVGSPEIWLDMDAPNRMPRQLRSGRATTARKPHLHLQLPRALLSLRSVPYQ